MLIDVKLKIDKWPYSRSAETELEFKNLKFWLLPRKILLYLVPYSANNVARWRQHITDTRSQIVNYAVILYLKYNLSYFLLQVVQQ